MEDIRLPDLETIRRFSIAVRSEHAPADEVLEALRMDLERVQRAVGSRRASAAATPKETPARGTRRSTTSRSSRAR